jgi:hypothetical protein
MFLTNTNNAVTTLTLSHPPVNAVSEAWVRAFDARLDELAQRAAEIAQRIAGLPAAALAASKAWIAAAGHKNRGGYTDELEFTRQLLNDAETRQRVQAFLAGSAKSSTQTKSGAAR